MGKTSTLWDGIDNSQLGSQFSNNYNPAAAQSAAIQEQNQATYRKLVTDQRYL